MIEEKRECHWQEPLQALNGLTYYAYAWSYMGYFANGVLILSATVAEYLMSWFIWSGSHLLPVMSPDSCCLLHTFDLTVRGLGSCALFIAPAHRSFVRSFASVSRTSLFPSLLRSDYVGLRLTSLLPSEDSQSQLLPS